MNGSTKCVGFVALFAAGFIPSAIHPRDSFTWFLEVFPAIIALAIFLVTYRWFKLTDITNLSILLLCYILFVGGHYTYAEVPLFNWIRDGLGQGRNNFDKLGHFAQGFAPALFFREIFIRFQVMAQKRWLPFLVVCTCTTISVLYEFLEWFVSFVTGEAAEAFLGTQGDVWDTQWDMLFAMIGAASAMVAMPAIQDRQIEALVNAEKNQKAHSRT